MMVMMTTVVFVECIKEEGVEGNDGDDGYDGDVGDYGDDSVDDNDGDDSVCGMYQRRRGYVEGNDVTDTHWCLVSLLPIQYTLLFSPTPIEDHSDDNRDSDVQ